MFCFYVHREEHDRRVAQQMHEEASREEQRQREIEVCIISFIKLHADNLCWLRVELVVLLQLL